MPAKKTTVRYVGGRDEVTVYMAAGSGDRFTVARGETVELLASDAEILLGGVEKNGVTFHPNPNWEPATKAPAKKDEDK